MPKSPPTKPKHSRDDSSLDKSSKLKVCIFLFKGCSILQENNYITKWKNIF